MEDPIGEPMVDVTLDSFIKTKHVLKTFTCINASGLSMYSSTKMVVMRNEDIHRKSLFIYPCHTYIYLRYIDTYVTFIYVYYSDHDSLFLIDTP